MIIKGVLIGLKYASNKYKTSKNRGGGLKNTVFISPAPLFFDVL
jgi:hypothetical protein